MRPNIKASRVLPIAAISLLLVLTGCKSKTLPPLPTPTPPPSSPSSSLPTPPSGGMPPPPMPSPSSPSSSPPSSKPSGQPSPPSQGSTSSSPSSPSLPSPGLPSPSSSDKNGKPDVAKGPKGPKGGGEQPPGEKSDAGSEPGSQRESRTQAGDDLQRAGEQIAKAGSGEVDPLIPETDSDSTEEGDVFSDSSSAAVSDNADSSESSGAASSSEGQESEAGGGEEQVAQSGQSGGGNPGDDSASGGGPDSEGGPSGGGIPGDLADEIRRAQEALAQAGGALQEAGAAVANAETDEELAAAEELLSDARIAVIMASQDIELLEDELQGTPGWGGAGEEIFEETSEALRNANIALVIATRSVLIAKTGSPVMPGGIPEGAILVEGNGEIAALEDELDESLVIFDGQIGDAREAVLSTTPPPETGSSGGPRPDGKSGEMMSLPSDEPLIEKPTEQQVASAEMPDLNQGDIPDAQGDDIVAQQLREAAMSEPDPELQAKLWEEYKRYKEGL
jgi:hypothetical protein